MEYICALNRFDDYVRKQKAIKDIVCLTIIIGGVQ